MGIETSAIRQTPVVLMLELLYVELDDESNPHVLLFITDGMGMYEFMPIMERIRNYIETEMKIKTFRPNMNYGVLRFVSRRDATMVKFRFDGSPLAEWEDD